MTGRGVAAPMRRGPRLAEILLQTGLVKEEDLGEARRTAEEQGRSLLYELVHRGLDEAELVRALGRSLRMPTVSLRGKKVDPDVLRMIPTELAEQYGCLPLFAKDEGGSRVLYLGVEDPTDQAVADDVSFRVGLRVVPVVVGPTELRRVLQTAHGETTAPRPVPPAPRLSELPLAQRDTEPVFPDETVAAVLSEREAEFTAEGPGDKPRDVPIRDILRAVVRLLIEKDLFTRAELMTAVRLVRESDPPTRV
jgi:Type II secretion system (T2SS), protein E, N-terminal domain